MALEAFKSRFYTSGENCIVLGIAEKIIRTSHDHEQYFWQPQIFTIVRVDGEETHRKDAV